MNLSSDPWISCRAPRGCYASSEILGVERNYLPCHWLHTCRCASFSLFLFLVATQQLSECSCHLLHAAACCAASRVRLRPWHAALSPTSLHTPLCPAPPRVLWPPPPSCTGVWPGQNSGGRRSPIAIFSLHFCIMPPEFSFIIVY